MALTISSEGGIAMAAAGLLRHKQVWYVRSRLSQSELLYIPDHETGVYVLSTFCLTYMSLICGPNAVAEAICAFLVSALRIPASKLLRSTSSDERAQLALAFQGREMTRTVLPAMYDSC